MITNHRGVPNLILKLPALQHDLHYWTFFSLQLFVYEIVYGVRFIRIIIKIINCSACDYYAPFGIYYNVNRDENRPNLLFFSLSIIFMI